MDESGVMQVASATAIFNETLTEEDAKKEGIAGMWRGRVNHTCAGYPADNHSPLRPRRQDEELLRPRRQGQGRRCVS
jgi:hypothetical protein